MADVDQLTVGISVAAWSVGLAVTGIAAGVAMCLMMDRLMKVDQSNPDLLTSKMPGVRSAVQIGLGTLALANLLALLLPPDVTSPIGDAALYFFFYFMQMTPLLGGLLPSGLATDINVLLGQILSKLNEALVPPTQATMEVGSTATAETVAPPNPSMTAKFPKLGSTKWRHKRV